MEHIYNQEQFGENWFTYPNLYKGFVEKLTDGSKIVEVGSWKGKSAAFLAVEVINSGKNISIDCIDIWEENATEGDSQNDLHVKTDALYELFLSNISPLSHIIKPIRMKSTDASTFYSDGSLDVVFLDADHTYEAVKADIHAWMPKVKSGGILAGHDYPWSHNHDVKRAVDELVKPITQSEGCWIYKKP